jgi:hypothetical protein
MNKKNPFNPLSYTKIDNNSKFMNLINYTVTKFCDSLGFNRGYFFQFLPYSENQLPKYFNPNDDNKVFKITDLELILDNLDTPHQKLILDYLCQKYGFVCSQSADIDTLQDDNIKDMLIALSASNGNLANCYINSVDDNVLSDEEIEELLNLSYKTRQQLINFENVLRAVK